MAEREIGAYSPATAKMILDVVRYLKANGFIIQGGQKTTHIGDASRVFLAYTTSTITARSGTTAGKGTATLKYIPGTDGTATTISDYASGASAINLYNHTTMAIASGTYLPTVRECASGKWIALVAGDVSCDVVKSVEIVGTVLQYTTVCDDEVTIADITTVCPPPP